MWALNHYRPASGTDYFESFDLASKESISRRIVWTIEHHGVAPVALVFGQRHWIVVRGYEASSAPTSADDASYTIAAFYIHIPWSPMPYPVSPSHIYGDGCGADGDLVGVANCRITYESWKNNYMIGVSRGHWAGKYLAVCDSGRPEP
jgi:hypothetical protein